MLSGFKKFIFRGNVVDLAVGVVIGAAFGAIVQSLVKDIITPVIAAIIKTPDFNGMQVMIRGSSITYGSFLNQLISFILVAAAIYFFVIIPMSKITFLKKDEPSTKECMECLSEIHAAAKRCKHCGQPTV